MLHKKEGYVLSPTGKDENGAPAVTVDNGNSATRRATQRSADDRVGRCTATVAATGAPCPVKAMHGKAFCYQHEPSVAEQRTLQRRLGGLRAVHRDVPVDISVDYASAEGVRRVLEEGSRAVVAGSISPAQAGALNSFASTALRLVEVQADLRELELAE